MDVNYTSLSLGGITAVGFTVFQVFTLNIKVEWCSKKIFAVSVLNLIYAYLTWISYRAITSSTATLQVLMAVGSTFVSWLSFAVISNTSGSDEILSVNRKQLLGMFVGLLLTVIDEMNKRLILGNNESLN